jgi:carboxyl-terminal processing protease
MKKLTLCLLCGMLLVACSQRDTTEVVVTASNDTASRDNLDQYFVESNSQSDSEAARKAAREAQLAELTSMMEQLKAAPNLASAFRIAENIEDLGRDIAPELQEAVAELPPMQRIAGLRAVWSLGSIRNRGWDVAVYGLLDIVIDENDEYDTEYQVAAAEVMGALASTRHQERLKKALFEQVFQPEVRVQLAVALWRSARDTDATDLLREMLQSRNDALRIQAALALGEINQLTSDARPILEMLAEQPTLRGRVAARSLEYGLAIRRLEAAIEGRLPGQDTTERIDVSMLDRLETMIRDRFIYVDAIDGKKLLYAAANGMLSELDPYTALLEESQLRDAGEIRRFEVPTLGLTLGSTRLRETREARLIRILSVRPGSPAARAGLRSGDTIYRVVRGRTADEIRNIRRDAGRLPREPRSFQSLQLADAVTRLQGAVGTTIGLQVMREDWLLSRWVPLKHEAAEYEPVQSELLPGDIGVVQISELTSASPARVTAAVRKLTEQGAKAFILDLRDSAGGNVEAASQVASLFLPENTLVTYSMGRSDELAPRREYRTSREGDTETPMVVLVNGGTSDAGEVLAGALYEHQRAHLAGERTFGRALLQELIPLSARELDEDSRQAALLLTVGRYHGPVSEVPYYDRGVDPETDLVPRLFEGWIYDEFENAEINPAFDAYLDKLESDMDADTLRSLARTDKRDPDSWPDLEKLHETLELNTGLEELRYLVRSHVRKRLAAAGVEINAVDLQEDTVFTGAVRKAAELADIDLSEIPEYSVLSR